MSELPSITVVGPGRVGTTLSVALARAGWPRVILAGRSAPALSDALGPAPSGLTTCALDGLQMSGDTWILAVTDDAIAEVCRDLADSGLIGRGAVMLHLSGAHSSAVLEPCRPCAALGSVHPLQTFPEPLTALQALPGSHWFAEGDPESLDTARRLVESLLGHFHVIETRHKVLYHAAAVFASNYLTAILGASLDCAAAAGLDPEEMLPALAPLSRAAFEAALRSGPGHSLTGPVSRGDADTVAAHIDALRTRPDLLDLYRSLARYSIDLATRCRRLDTDAGVRLEAALDAPNIADS